jgi:small conductance mechanosensitive channel
LDSIDSVFAVLQNIISSESRFLNAPPPQIIVQSMQDCHVVVVIRAWASIQDFWDVHWYQMRNIRERIEEAGFKIPFPQQDVHLIQDLNVNAGN